MPEHPTATHAALDWQVLPTIVGDGPFNMALDDAMANRARAAGRALVRVYGWSGPVLSLGRHQKAAGLYDRRAAAEREIGIVRRPTGGRAVLHLREITYCIAAPEQSFGSLTQAYRAINQLLVDALQQLGIDASVAPAHGPPPRPMAGACFEEPVAGEIVARGRKLVGSAQWRNAGGLLQHGSILVADDQGMATELMVSPVPSPPPAATLRDLLGRTPSLEEFECALAGAVARRFATAPDRVPLDRELAALAQERCAHYASDGWTWRR